MNLFLRAGTTCAILLSTSTAAVAVVTMSTSARADAEVGSPRNAPPPSGPSTPTAPTTPAPSTPPAPPGPTTPPPVPTGTAPSVDLTPPPMVLQPTQPLVLDPNSGGTSPRTTTRNGMPVEALRPEIRITTWDLNLDFGYGAVIDTPENRPSYFMRARAGVLHVRDDWFYTAGLTYDLVKVFRVGGYDATNFGIQLEAMHIQYGVWGQVGGLVDATGHGGFTAAAGWSLFGIEYQARTYEDLGPVQAVYGKIRIPVTIIYHAVVKHDL